MNVVELNNLSDWFRDHHAELGPRYTALKNPVHHNATQPNKQALEEPMSNLLSYLEGMSFSTLSLEQLALLEHKQVRQFLGTEGAARVRSAIQTSEYDPVTASSQLDEAINALNSANSAFTAYHEAMNQLDIELPLFEPDPDAITIRVGFRNGADINNVTDLKNSARDWYDILRGISMAVGEPPESTRVVGAGTGSFILYLVAGATVTFLLARISKHLTGIAKDIISVESAREDLRQKKMLSKVIENDLNSQIKALNENAIDVVTAQVKETVDNLDGEAETALVKAVKKLLTFNRDGGDVDFVTPGDGDEDDQADSPISNAREAILEYQTMRDEVRLLTDQSPPANDV